MNTAKSELSRTAGGRVTWHSPFRVHLVTHTRGLQSVRGRRGLLLHLWAKAYPSLHCEPGSLLQLGLLLQWLLSACGHGPSLPSAEPLVLSSLLALFS